MAHDTDTSIGGLMRSAMDDVRELFREEVALARAELRHELTKASGAAMQFGIAGAALLFAATCFVIALALGISAVFEWPAWAGFSVVAVLLAAVGALAFSSGRRAVRTVQPLPRTLHSIKENFR
jgi:uncharacterized membrane protein YqjE